MNKEDVLCIFQEILDRAAAYYDNALNNMSFERDNEKEISIIEKILSDLPESFTIENKNFRKERRKGWGKGWE